MAGELVQEEDERCRGRLVPRKREREHLRQELFVAQARLRIDGGVGLDYEDQAFREDGMLLPQETY